MNNFIITKRLKGIGAMTNRPRRPNMKYQHTARYFTFLGLVFLLLNATIHGQTQWTTNGISIASATESQVHIGVISDNLGGAFLAWQNNPFGDSDIFAQRVDKIGNKRWEDNGVLVCGSGGNQEYPTLCRDETGGIILAWQDASGPDINIYAQRLGAAGESRWQSNGIPICTATGDQTLPQIIPDTAGGAIIVWRDKRYGSATDLFAQRIDSSGTLLWNADGNPITLAGGNQSAHQICEDGSGGAFVTWQDNRNGNYDVFAQRISQGGTNLWTSDVPVVTNAFQQWNPKLIRTADGAIVIAWHDERSGNYDIYAQKLNPDGSVQWTGEGVGVVTALNNQSNVVLAVDEDGGTILSWWDQRSGNYDIYAQKLDNNGQRSWVTAGVPVVAVGGDQFSPCIVSDGSDGVIVVWSDFRNGLDIDLYAQRLDRNGATQWHPDGLVVAAASGNQAYHAVTSDNSGGALLFWQDGRNGQSDLYGASLNDAIRIDSPDGDTVWAGDQTQTIRWESRVPSPRFDQLTFRYSTILGDGFPYVIAEGIDPSLTEQEWSIPVLNTNAARIKIQAFDPEATLLYEYTTDDFTIDSDPPDEFDLLLPGNGVSTNPTPTFQWEQAADNLSGIDHYELWIDDTLFQDTLSTTTYTLTEAQKLDPTWHTWTVKVSDKAGLIRQASHT